MRVHVYVRARTRPRSMPLPLLLDHRIRELGLLPTLRPSTRLLENLSCSASLASSRSVPTNQAGPTLRSDTDRSPRPTRARTPRRFRRLRRTFGSVVRRVATLRAETTHSVNAAHAPNLVHCPRLVRRPSCSPQRSRRMLPARRFPRMSARARTTSPTPVLVPSSPLNRSASRPCATRMTSRTTHSRLHLFPNPWRTRIILWQLIGGITRSCLEMSATRPTPVAFYAARRCRSPSSTVSEAGRRRC
jgi:hypothetical protein